MLDQAELQAYSLIRRNSSSYLKAELLNPMPTDNMNELWTCWMIAECHGSGISSDAGIAHILIQRRHRETLNCTHQNVIVPRPR